MMRKQQTATSLQGLLKSMRNSAKIEYQPGYAPKEELTLSRSGERALSAGASFFGFLVGSVSGGVIAVETVAFADQPAAVLVEDHAGEP